MDGVDRQQALVEAGIALASELELDTILQKLVQTAAALTQARYAALGVIGRDGMTLDRFVTHGLTPKERDAIGRAPQGRGILGVLISDARPLRLHDLCADPRAVGFPEGHPPMRSFLGVPVLLRGHAFGNLYLTEKAAGVDFTEDDEELATALAAQAAVAIDNASRIERGVLTRAVEAQEAERRRLARELHDGVGQSLTSVLLGLSSVDAATSLEETKSTISSLRELVVATLRDVRQMAVELRPKALDDFGLAPALARLGEGLRETSSIDVQVSTRLGSDRLPAAVETAIYRIAQEALANAMRHAQPKTVSIVATRWSNRVTMVIEDDGRGFDPTAAVDGMGLASMRERAELLYGSVVIDSTLGRGTEIVLELPLEPPSAEGTA